MDIQGIDGVGCISLAADDDVLTMRFCDLGEREMAFTGAICIECWLEVRTACRESWYFLFGSSYPDTRFRSHFHLILLRYSYYEGLDPYL